MNNDTYLANLNNLLGKNLISIDEYNYFENLLAKNNFFNEEQKAKIETIFNNNIKTLENHKVLISNSYIPLDNRLINNGWNNSKFIEKEDKYIFKIPKKNEIMKINENINNNETFNLSSTYTKFDYLFLDNLRKYNKLALVLNDTINQGGFLKLLVNNNVNKENVFIEIKENENKTFSLRLKNEEKEVLFTSKLEFKSTKDINYKFIQNFIYENYKTENNKNEINPLRNLTIVYAEILKTIDPNINNSFNNIIKNYIKDNTEKFTTKNDSNRFILVEKNDDKYLVGNMIYSSYSNNFYIEDLSSFKNKDEQFIYDSIKELQEKVTEISLKIKLNLNLNKEYEVFGNNNPLIVQLIKENNENNELLYEQKDKLIENISNLENELRELVDTNKEKEQNNIEIN